MRGRLQRLRAELASDRCMFESHVESLDDLDLSSSSPPGDTARAAVALHHAYGAIEACMERIARLRDQCHCVRPSVATELDRFDAFLLALLAETEK